MRRQRKDGKWRERDEEREGKSVTEEEEGVERPCCIQWLMMSSRGSAS